MCCAVCPFVLRAISPKINIRSVCYRGILAHHRLCNQKHGGFPFALLVGHGNRLAACWGLFGLPGATHVDRVVGRPGNLTYFLGTLTIDGR